MPEPQPSAADMDAVQDLSSVLRQTEDYIIPKMVRPYLACFRAEAREEALARHQQNFLAYCDENDAQESREVEALRAQLAAKEAECEAVKKAAMRVVQEFEDSFFYDRWGDGAQWNISQESLDGLHRVADPSTFYDGPRCPHCRCVEFIHEPGDIDEPGGFVRCRLCASGLPRAALSSSDAGEVRDA